jgi:hypothetical protein
MRTVLLVAALGLPMMAATPLGKGVTLKTTTPIPALLSQPASYLDKMVQVKGKVTEVCDKAGCWMALQDPGSGQSIRIKVNDGDIVFPETAVGKMAMAEGTFQKVEMTKEQAIPYLKHEAEEKGRKFDPASVTGPLTIYRIWGLGALLMD